jgi:hypothetical protein
MEPLKMKKFLVILSILFLFSCEHIDPAEDGPLFCFDCWQEHIAPNEHWKVNMIFCRTSEESIIHIIKSNTYSNTDSTRKEILTCTKSYTPDLKAAYKPNV